MSQSDPRITLEVRGHVAVIGINRPEKRNAFDVGMLRAFSAAMTEADRNPEVRCMLVHAVGDHFSAGLDLANVAPALKQGEGLAPKDSVDPWATHGLTRTKPLVVAVQGLCLTLSIELVLAADITVASEDARFGQIEIKRGIFPFGGATLRFPQVAGWGNAMRWLLTGDEFDAREAYRIGLVQEVVARGQQLERALALAQTVAKQAPLGVQATLASARQTLTEGPEAAARDLLPRLRQLNDSEDAAEGVRSFIERREGRFSGR
ncbi:crotonase/enoyl-CoA hydratase family protein [Pyxidicoccus fallax]|uniref:Crotonase/enoyl-CoA hydratase family protein n=1 Tax=Pyxidicoccus fallax TaxID=394095 RepID=A0A848LW42_9BACT|nr:crotonase/enoyl-CoA hydratase family protein [Pyxidicoccus fallax]NMO21869.1 crotonase/enoyl-CoA hydratase family protein [Pyxidicoccus fallax]NPC85897.1 crotonase/enoyl-CoA hydratase family protein [Pyxidicoccus fallax]